MTPDVFIKKWTGVALTERSAAQQHFLDLCALTGHPTPAEADPAGEWFTFERGAEKSGGGDGFADVWKRGFFAIEYKGRHKDLDKADQQILLYREALRTRIENLLSTGTKSGRATAKMTPQKFRKAAGEANMIKERFLERLGRVTVLDPACGSGNFLYVTLQKLKNLEKEVALYGGERGLASDFLPRVAPWQMHGIEISPYAFELAQMALWIGYLQWTRHNGYGFTDSPLLRKMTTFRNGDAILDLSNPENPGEPEWPKVDFIVGNPPFLGDKLMRRELGDGYVESLRKLFADRIPGQSDLCCY